MSCELCFATDRDEHLLHCTLHNLFLHAADCAGRRVLQRMLGRLATSFTSAFSHTCARHTACCRFWQPVYRWVHRCSRFPWQGSTPSSLRQLAKESVQCCRGLCLGTWQASYCYAQR